MFSLDSLQALKTVFLSMVIILHGVLYLIFPWNSFIFLDVILEFYKHKNANIFPKYSISPSTSIPHGLLLDIIQQVSCLSLLLVVSILFSWLRSILIVHIHISPRKHFLCIVESVTNSNHYKFYFTKHISYFNFYSFIY